MNKDIGNKLYEKEVNPSLDDEEVNTKIIQILSQYENGIQSIFESSKKEGEENYLMLLFNCPDWFHKKFSNLTKSNSNLFNSSMIIKYFNGIEKKLMKSNETKSELEMSRMSSVCNKDNLEINIEEEKNDYVNMIKKIFEKFFGANENLLERLIKKYLLLKKSENNNEFNYEDFIVIFCCLTFCFPSYRISQRNYKFCI